MSRLRFPRWLSVALLASLVLSALSAPPASASPAANEPATVYTLPGSFNSELGCPGDWLPDCLATSLSDADGDGVFTFVTDAIPAGSYEFKVALNLSWDINYGQGGVQDGANVPFTVAGPSTVTFSFNSATNVPGVAVLSSLPGPDNNVEWDGLRHDSRDTLYRTPGGAVPAGTAVTIRLRTFHNDVTDVTLRVFDVNGGAQRFLPMAPAAQDVSCYDEALAGKSCDFWAVTLEEASPNNLWYRFIVTDGSDTNYYADDTAALDGGLGNTYDAPEDRSFALMFFDPAFRAPRWASSAVIYQIFPDRFRNGQPNNDPQTGDIRYDDPVIKLDWGTLPEGYCRSYADANTSCPWRFDTTPPEWSPTREGPRGRDYFGGDLRGVTQQLGYLRSLGVTTIYFNPIFDAGSNHSYDTQDYYRVDPYFGSQRDWEGLVREARRQNIRIILDSVFNHMSSDSAYFDRYSHYPTEGACESAASIYRSWFNFRAPTGIEPGPCAPSTPGGADTYYTGWFGFDSIPELNKSNPAVQEYFVTGPNSVSRHWLRQGAAGWRLDVMGDASFPAGYWESFRQVTRETRGDSLIIGELWQKDSTLLRHLRGQTADSTMNYRLRDATLGLLAPQSFDSKGFADSGRSIAPSEFASRVLSIREDYPDPAYYSLMNLLGSHDTERILWTLTPGEETRASREENAANVAEGKARLRLASLIQFTMPGAPTVYYGDEVGVTGDDDPDDRRTYPWPDTGGTPDSALFSHYRTLAKLRRVYPELASGDIAFLLADDQKNVVAYSRQESNRATIVLINRGTSEQTVSVPVAGFLPEGARLTPALGVGMGTGERYRVQNGAVNGAAGVRLAPLSGLVLTVRGSDLTAPDAPRRLEAVEGEGQVGLSWRSVGGADAYNVYRSPVSGGGWVRVNASPLRATELTDTGVENGRRYYYAVTALDRWGNESAPSAEVSALPHLEIDWANLQWPAQVDHTISAVNRTPDIYGQVYIEGPEGTSAPGATPNLRAQLGYGPAGTAPTSDAWLWVDASFNVQAGNNDEFKASLLPESVGSFDYTYRYTTTGGRDWVLAVAGPGGGSPLGRLNVQPAGDTTAPAVPTGLSVTSASPAGIGLAWDAVVGDASLYGYEVGRATTAGGPFTVVARITGTSYSDTSVQQGETYFYAVRSLDEALNRSAFSSAVEAVAALRTVTVTFNVTVPAPVEDAVGRSVYIAGFINRLDPLVPGVPNPEWNPGGVSLTQVSDTLWQITFTGKEGTQIEYKYALGSWDFVEKDGACGEISNRQLTLAYGSTGLQTVNDSVLSWRNVAPCGN